MTHEGDFADRLAQIQDRIAAAADRSGRSAKEITLVAVSKRQPIEEIIKAHSFGLTDFGENYVQEALDKSGSPSTPLCRWHMLGHLQSNKAKAAVQTFDLVQSVDSIRLASVLGSAAMSSGKVQKILLQVHLGDEVTKSGLPPSLVGDTVPEIQSIPGVSLLGLMGIASQAEEVRPQFRGLRHLYEALPEPARSVLSMGMTGDFEVAIEEGATMIRIGTALFGERQ